LLDILLWHARNRRNLFSSYPTDRKQKPEIKQLNFPQKGKKYNMEFLKGKLYGLCFS
jgi:hypothetical protein